MDTPDQLCGASDLSTDNVDAALALEQVKGVPTPDNAPHRDGSASWAVLKTFAFRVMMLVVNFGTGVTVARTLAPLGRGEQTALALWPLLLPSLATLGLPLAIIYNSRRRPDDAGRFYFVGVITMIVTGCFVALVGAIAMPYILRGYDPLLVRYAQWFMLFAPQVLTQLVIRAHFEANGEFTRSILTQLVPTFLTLVALLILRFLNLLSPVTAALCYLAPPCLVTFSLLIQTWPRMVPGFVSFREDVAILLTYGLRSYGADLINALSGQIDVAIIVAFLNPVALGLYSVAISISHLLYIVQTSIVTVLFPHASGLEADAAISLIGRTARLSLLVSIVFAGVLIAVAPPVLPLVYGQDFQSAVMLIPLLTIEAVLTGICWVLGTAFQTTGRPVVVTLMQTGWFACALVLLVVLVPRMQTIGAAVALMLASLFRFILMVVCYRIVLHRNLPQLFPNASDVAYIYGKMKILASRRRSLSVEV